MRLIPDFVMGVICVFQEAEGEPYEGKVAVAEVILNRSRKKFMSDGTVTGTVLRRLQFSGFNSDAANRIRSFKIDTDDHTVQDCIRAWKEAEAGSTLTNGALHYYATWMNPPPLWAKDAEVLAEIGQHRFVKPKGGQ